MFTLFDIPHDMLVTGAVQVQHPNAAGTGVDLSRLNPGARAALEAQQAAMGNYQRLDETDDGSSVQTSTISSQEPGIHPQKPKLGALLGFLLILSNKGLNRTFLF